jgi:hypothetical protein
VARLVFLSSYGIHHHNASRQLFALARWRSSNCRC